MYLEFFIFERFVFFCVSRGFFVNIYFFGILCWYQLLYLFYERFGENIINFFLCELIDRINESNIFFFYLFWLVVREVIFFL